MPAKKAFEGEPNYNKNTALAIPNAEMDRLNIDHGLVTGAQMTLYKAFAKTNQKLTWEVVSTIETKALVAGGMKESTAKI